MQNRLVGREQEYAMKIIPVFMPPPFPPLTVLTQQEFVQSVQALREQWRAEFVSEIIFKIMQSESAYFFDARSNNHRLWLRNGGLTYIDLGSILEFASAEYEPCSLDGVLQEKASERILNRALEKVIAERGLQEFSLFKNNVGPGERGDIYDEVSYASHHNYSYQTNKRERVYALLTNFIPASLPLTGSGHVYRSHRLGVGNQFCFTLSQRVPHINLLKSSGTLRGDRGIVNTRDEPLMDLSCGLSRLHIISHDATRCEFQTWLVDAIMHLVLRIAEEVEDEKVLPPDLKDPRAELEAINFSLEANFDYQVRLAVPYLALLSGKKDLFEYNYLFLDLAKQLSPLSDNEKKALEAWEEILELLMARAFNKLVGKLDWVTKWKLLRRQMKREGFELSDPQAWLIDMEYHNISNDPNLSWYARLEERGYIQHLVDEEEIVRTMLVPPPTRARCRGDLLELIKTNSRLWYQVTRFNWDGAKFNNYQDMIYFGEKDNPFVPTSSSIDKLCRDLNLKKDTPQ
ncbi:MAG: proteasome accessory factor PafA2 family protein [Candidatus Harrisonbacteria bacterium]|nr:proteasome accessory factor PafA2 family protein [Candidatus Harrisonbacteria bacterium]